MRFRSPAGGRRSARLRRSVLAVVLGLSRRPAPPAAGDRTRRASPASSYEAPVGADAMQFGRAYWLPPFGRGNGLDALFWAPLARLPEDRVDAALVALGDRGIPAWAAPAGRRAAGAPGNGEQDVSVAAADLDAAQDVLMRVLRG